MIWTSNIEVKEQRTRKMYEYGQQVELFRLLIFDEWPIRTRTKNRVSIKLAVKEWMKDIGVTLKDASWATGGNLLVAQGLLAPYVGLKA